MNKTFFISTVVSFLVILAFGLPVTTYAATGQYNYVAETDTTYTAHIGTYNNITTTGYSSSGSPHSYQSMDGNATNTWRWKCNSSTTSNYNYHTWIAIPSNAGVLDGIYKYYAYNTVPAENFSVNINQENYSNQWVYIGWTQGTGGKNACYVEVNNFPYFTDQPREFWIDHMKYWPNLTTTPAGTHSW